MSLVDARTSRVLFTVLVFALALGFLYVARQTLIAFLFAIFFAYLVDPAISRIEKLVRGRGRAIAIIYLLLMMLLGSFFFLVGPRIIPQAQHLGEALPTLLENVGTGRIAEQLGQERGWSQKTTQQLKTFLANHRETIVGVAQRVGIRLAELAQHVGLLLLVPILAAFFLRDGQAFSRVLLSFASARPQREFLEGVLNDMNQMLAHFIRAQLTLAALSLLAYSSFLAIMKAPYWLVLGTAGGMMEFVPVVGPLVAAMVIVGVCLLMGYKHWFIVLLFLGIWRIVQDYVVSPRIMGRSLQLHPLAAIFGVLAGAEMAGVLGVYLSIPIMASLRIVWRRSRLYAEKKRFGPLNEYTFGPDLNRTI